MVDSRLTRVLDVEQQRDDLAAELEAAFADFIADCHYPQGKGGERMQAEFFVTLVAYHMVRCGWRRSADPIIKKRKVDAPGVVADAIEWVAVDAPDDPLEGVEDMTFAQISELPEFLRRKAIARLGGGQLADDDLPDMGEPGWQVTPNISYSTESPSGDDFLNGAADAR